jgi:hypothetical protein
LVKLQLITHAQAPLLPYPSDPEYGGATHPILAPVTPYTPPNQYPPYTGGGPKCTAGILDPSSPILTKDVNGVLRFYITWQGPDCGAFATEEPGQQGPRASVWGAWINLGDNNDGIVRWDQATGIDPADMTLLVAGTQYVGSGYDNNEHTTAAVPQLVIAHNGGIYLFWDANYEDDANCSSQMANCGKRLVKRGARLALFPNNKLYLENSGEQWNDAVNGYPAASLPTPFTPPISVQVTDVGNSRGPANTNGFGFCSHTNRVNCNVAIADGGFYVSPYSNRLIQMTMTGVDLLPVDNTAGSCDHINPPQPGCSRLDFRSIAPLADPLSPVNFFDAWYMSNFELPMNATAYPRIAISPTGTEYLFTLMYNIDSGAANSTYWPLFPQHADQISNAPGQKVFPLLRSDTWAWTHS